LDQPDSSAAKDPHPQGEFQGFVAVVIGAAQGIGRATAEEPHAGSARLLLIDRNGPALSATADDLELFNTSQGCLYSRTTSHTFEEYFIRQRLEMGKLLLLDPRLSVT